MDEKINNSLNIFILYKSAEFAHELKKILSGFECKKNIEIKSAASVDSAVEILNAFQCDIILQHMEAGEQELDSFIMIKQKHPGLPVIILADECRYNIDMKAVSMGVQDFINIKKMDSGRLEKAVLYAIGRKKREIEQAESEDKWRQLVQNSSDIILNVSYDGTILFINKKSSLISAKMDLGKNLYDLVSPGNHKKIKNAIDKIYNRGKFISLKVTAVRNERSVKSFTARMSPIRKNDRVVAVNITITDVTRLIRLEKEMHQARTLESIGMLAAGIAHEINTPIQYIQDNMLFLNDSMINILEYIGTIKKLAEKQHGKAGSASEMINKIAGESDIEYLENEMPSAISQSLEGIDRIKKIVNAIKHFSHVDREEPEKADINLAIENSVMISKNEWKYVAEVETDLDPAIPEIKCFISGINQALMNIIVNAAHAISDVTEGGKKGKGLIRISSKIENGSVIIKVKDTGTGIPDGIREKIFHPFFTTKAAGKGTGQGLAIAYDTIVKKHKGNISVDSEPGKGSAFTITLPANTD